MQTIRSHEWVNTTLAAGAGGVVISAKKTALDDDYELFVYSKHNDHTFTIQLFYHGEATPDMISVTMENIDAVCRDALYKMQSHFSEQVNHNQKRLSQVYDWLYEGECGI